MQQNFQNKVGNTETAFRLLYIPDSDFDSLDLNLGHCFMFKYLPQERITLLRLLGQLAADNCNPLTFHDAAVVSDLIRSHPKLQGGRE